MSKFCAITVLESWNEAEVTMRETAGAGSTLKLAESGGARTSKWRNQTLQMTRENHRLWIDPEKYPFYRKVYACVFHTRSRSVPKI